MLGLSLLCFVKYSHLAANFERQSLIVQDNVVYQHQL